MQGLTAESNGPETAINMMRIGTEPGPREKAFSPASLN
jgi:hypothetical protein